MKTCPRTGQDPWERPQNDEESHPLQYPRGSVYHEMRGSNDRTCNDYDFSLWIYLDIFRISQAMVTGSDWKGLIRQWIKLQLLRQHWSRLTSFFQELLASLPERYMSGGINWRRYAWQEQRGTSKTKDNVYNIVVVFKSIDSLTSGSLSPSTTSR